MPESQNCEYKLAWKDDFLKWICGFANANGGQIFLGLSDEGEVIGLSNSKKLMEDIPNKIRDTIGIMADVNLHERDGKKYIEIKVNPSAFPVSYHGEYHYRSGSTRQLLTGSSLTAFLMRKTGMRWEDVTVDGISIDDLDEESFKIFKREALRSKRMTSQELDIPRVELLKKLHLIREGKLTRAAVLLFYDDPEVVQVGSFVKVGKFANQADLLYQHVLQGSLLYAADKVIDLIYLMYLKAKISYEHDVRVETYPYVREAVREAVFNAIIHNCYMFGTPIQIRIDEEEMVISNSCILPEGWTVDTLMENHTSEPYNPHIAGVFYRAGYIENWGRGIQKICIACDELGAERPEYQILGHGIRVKFTALKSALFDEESSRANSIDPAIKKPVTLEVPLEQQDVPLKDTLEKKILDMIKTHPSATAVQISKALETTDRTVKRYLKRMQEKGLIKRNGGKRYGYWDIL